MSKKDALATVVIGIIVALISFAVIGNLGLIIPFKELLIVVFPILCLLGLFVASVIAEKIPVIFQIAKFGLVGVLNTLVDWGVLNFLMWISSVSSGSAYSFFKSISFVFALANSYFWNRFWTFKEEKNEERSEKKDESKTAGSFFAVSFFTFLVNVATASIIVNFIGSQWGLSDELWGNIGAIAGSVVSLFLNFVGYKFFVFKK